MSISTRGLEVKFNIFQYFCYFHRPESASAGFNMTDQHKTVLNYKVRGKLFKNRYKSNP